MIAASVLLAGRRRGAVPPRALALDLALLIGVILLAAVLYSGTVRLRLDFTFSSRLFGLGAAWAVEWLDPIEEVVNKGFRYGSPLLAACLLRRRPLFLGLALVGALATVGFVDARNDDQVLQARSFFGVLRISRDRDEDDGYIEMRHGTTLHGRQSLDPKRRAEPVSYYHRGGPVSQVFEELDRHQGSRRVAVIGLGTGTLAAYARPGDAMTFYEIDTLVRDVAVNRAYFTYLGDARDRGATIRVEMGDARIRLEAVKRERPGERYDLLAVDAFSSDAIPVHLLTREALRLYLDVLKPDGVLAIHISNRYLHLAPVVANLAQDAGLRGRLIQEDEATETKGAASSTWTVLARSPEALGGLPADPRWTRDRLETDRRVGVWTDEFHNLLAVFKWR
jgi:SAM-dependent methyltransferase